MTELVSKKLDFQIGPITPANIQQLRVLNLKTLPVRYSDKFYKELTSIYSNEFMRFAFWNGFVVGAVCARIEDEKELDTKKLYIMTINVLPAYRRRGIASELLKHVMDKAKEDKTITEAYLHVQISNKEAKEFYIKEGFTEIKIIENYYKRIDPPHCFLLSKSLVEM